MCRKALTLHLWSHPTPTNWSIYPCPIIYFSPMIHLHQQIFIEGFRKKGVPGHNLLIFAEILHEINNNSPTKGKFQAQNSSLMHRYSLNRLVQLFGRLMKIDWLLTAQWVVYVINSHAKYQKPASKDKKL